jgi:tyrosyl-tRNA synthetase
MREHGLRPQVVMTVPILEGTNAREEGGRIVGDKMSKSLDNYVGVSEPPEEQFGKLMSIGDGVMWRYYELLSSLDRSQVADRKMQCDLGRMNPKVLLAKEIVGRYHDAAAADRAHEKWDAQFSRREVPSDIPTFVVTADGGSIWLPKALAEARLVKSSTDGRRRIEQGAVEVDGHRVTDPKTTLAAGGSFVVKAGKRAWARLVVKIAEE